MAYSQLDPRWEWDTIGTSSLAVGQYGCLLTAFATALTYAGWTTTPAQVAAAPIFTKGGLFDWYPAKAYYGHITAFATNQSLEYVFCCVTATFPSGYVGEHWILLTGGQVIDPLYGNVSTKIPSNYIPTGIYRSYSITKNPAAVSVQVIDTVATPRSTISFEPFTDNLNPSQVYSDEVKRVQQYLVAKGFMADPGDQYGYYGHKTQVAIDAFQKSHGIHADPQYFGLWYDLTRAAANKDLSISTPNQA